MRRSMPGLKTRSSNALTHPGRAAGLEPKKRGSREEQAEARLAKEAAAAAELAEAEATRAEGLARVAALEDKQRREDAAYATTANHPVDRPLKRTEIQSSDDEEEPAPKRPRAANPANANKDGSGDDSNPYNPSGSDSSEDESADDSDDDDKPKKKSKSKKPPATQRADIAAARQTKDSTGTPSIEQATSKNKTRESSKKSRPKQPKKKSGINKDAVKRAASGPAPEDDSMVAMGGPAMDDDTGEAVERPKKGKKAVGMPSALIAVTSIASKPLTKKAVRGGALKWTLKDLPPGTAAEFSDELVPRARELAGTLNPWLSLTLKQVRELVDDVFGKDKYEVTKNGVWFGLVTYRVTDWRSGIGFRAIEGFENIIANYEPPAANNNQAVEGGPPGDAEEPSDAPAAANAMDTTATEAAGDTAGFRLDTPEGVRDCVKFALQLDAEGHTRAYQWQDWGDGIEKKGFLQTELIAYTYAYHLGWLAAIPGGYKKLEARPVGALLLCVQAVQRALQFWRSGEYVHNPKDKKQHFSIDNWGDWIERKPTGDLTHRRATKFLSSVKMWEADQWDTLEAEAKDNGWVERGKRAVTISRSASEAEDDPMPKYADDDIIVVSD
ncbi:hypothetical protein C8R43DRAFT_1242445 [Mycena crocata]|nr:hypothetical protein C8R43DRAFT_1242445 [Mycena crocata]